MQTYDRVIADLPAARPGRNGPGDGADRYCQVEPAAQVDGASRGRYRAVSILDQAGADVSYERTPRAIPISLTLRIQGDDVLIMYDTSNATAWVDDYARDRPAAVRQTAARAGSSTTTMAIGTDAGSLFSADGGCGPPALNAGLNGKSVYSGISPLERQARRTAI